MAERTSDPVLCEVWTESFNKSQLKESLIGHPWQSKPTYSHIKIQLEGTQLHVLTNSKQDRWIPYTVHTGCELWVIILYHTSSGWSIIELLYGAKPLFSTAPDRYCCNPQTQTAGSASHRETENVRRVIRREKYKRIMTNFHTFRSQPWLTEMKGRRQKKWIRETEKPGC